MKDETSEKLVELRDAEGWRVAEEAAELSEGRKGTTLPRGTGPGGGGGALLLGGAFCCILRLCALHLR